MALVASRLANMDVELLKTVGQVAGIGGLALGVFLLLFRDIIRKRIFPQLTRTQAFRLLLILSVLIWSVALAGIGAWVWTETRVSKASGNSGGVTATGGVAAGGDIRDSRISITPPLESSTQQKPKD